MDPDGHFNVPEGTASIEFESWEEWGVNKGGVTSVTIPTSVTIIANATFFECSSITRIDIPTSVTSIGPWDFYGCSSFKSVDIPTSVTSIDEGAFVECSGIDHQAAVEPVGDVAVDAKEDNANSGLWSELAGNVIEDDDSAEEDAPDSPPTTIARVWAPDCIIKQLTGPFAAYNTFKDLPRAMRVAPDAKTWAAVELWRWWAAPTHVREDRRACVDRRRTVFAVMMSGARAERLALLPRFPEELWLYTFSFLKHAEAPRYV